MLKKLTENIFQLVVRFKGAMGEVNCYLIKGENGYTVIDTGIYATETKETWRSVLDKFHIEKLILTHTHEDHIGLAKWFQEEYAVPVYVSKRGYKEMLKGKDRKAHMERMKSLIKRHGTPPLPIKIKDFSFIYDFEPAGFFDDFDQIMLGNQSFQAIWTPGHAPDHYCFYNKQEGIMIIGDHVLEHLSPVIGLWMGEEVNPLKDYLPSLLELQQYPSRLALPGHGKVIENLSERITETYNRHLFRLEELKQLLSDKPMSAFKITTKIYGPMKGAAFVSQFMATLTRLIYLAENQDILSIEKNGKVLYKAK